MSLIYGGKRRNVIDIFHIFSTEFNVLMHYLIHSEHIKVVAHV